MRELAAQVDAARGATLVVNPTARPRSGIVEARVPGTGDARSSTRTAHRVRPSCSTTTGSVSPPILVTGQKVRWVLDLMRGTEFQGRQIASYDVRDTGDGHDVELHEAAAGEERCDLGELRQQMLQLGEAGQRLRVRLVEAPGRRVLFDTGDIDGFGWACFAARDGASPDGPVRALANEHLRVDVDPTDGTYTIETTDGLRVAGLGRLVDGGDGGDTYNYSPPTEDVVIDRPDSVTVTTTEDGPGAGARRGRRGIHVAG